MATNAPVYELIKGLTGTDVDDTTAVDTSTAPYWCICVFPLGYPLSFSRKKMASASDFPADGAKLRGPRLIITGDVTRLSVMNSKRTHTKSLSATLSKGNVNYLVEILPGDWVMAWICNYEETITGKNGIIERLQQGQACNYWNDGLKFVGRVDSVRKTLSRSGVSLDVQYSLTATGFKELDNQIFYDPNLAEYAQKQVGTWLGKIGFDITELFRRSSNGTIQDNTHILIPALFEILFGKGLPSTINPAGKGVLQVTTGSLAPSDANNPSPKEAPFAYLVPEEVGSALNKRSRSKDGGILAYADIMELVFGVQTYENTNSTGSDYNKFLPTIDDQNELTTQQHRYTGVPMLGAYLPLTPTFTNTPFWNVLEQFLNPVCNEMYTCLRVNEFGHVVPQLVLRQIPFTTDSFNADAALQGDTDATSGLNSISSGDNNNSNQNNHSVNVTRFLNLPRWKMHKSMLNVLDVGRSDATRINFVHIYGQNGYNAGIPIVRQLVTNPPIRDDLDIQRSGLRPYITTIAVDAVNQVGKIPTVWMQLVADRMIGSQFSINGTMVSTGIQEPICEGDNLEFQGVVYHIEGVQHEASINPDGIRSFATVLQLSNGLDAQPDVPSSTAVNQEASIYPGIDDSTLSDSDPGVTVDHTNDEAETNGGLGSDKPKNGTNSGTEE